MNRPLSDYRLGRIILWPLYLLTQLAWFLFCVFGTIAAGLIAIFRPRIGRKK